MRACVRASAHGLARAPPPFLSSVALAQALSYGQETPGQGLWPSRPAPGLRVPQQGDTVSAGCQPQLAVGGAPGREIGGRALVADQRNLVPFPGLSFLINFKALRL